MKTALFVSVDSRTAQPHHLPSMATTSKPAQEVGKAWKRLRCRLCLPRPAEQQSAPADKFIRWPRLDTMTLMRPSVVQAFGDDYPVCVCRFENFPPPLLSFDGRNTTCLYGVGPSVRLIVIARTHHEQRSITRCSVATTSYDPPFTA